MNKHTPIRKRTHPLPDAERKRAWQAENAGAIDSYNDWVRKNGVLLGPFRQT
jgi:post-segregation antitoxin (ccd killing protein)